MRLILGSASPRRLELLAQIGITPDATRPADIDETPLRAEIPRVYVARMAREKLAAVPRDITEIVLTADTTVALGRRILGKPESKAQAAEFLLALGGRRHTVITAIAVGRGEKVWQRVVTSAVKFKRLSDDELNRYLDGGDWQGKAGGYGIQGPAAAFVLWISGSYSAIVGLPLAETASLLTAAGYQQGAA